MSIKLYVITASKSVDELIDLIHPSRRNSCDMSIIFKRNPKRDLAGTDKTILYTCDPLVVDDFKFAKIAITDYNWNALNQPNKGKGENDNLHFSGFPTNITQGRLTQLVNEKLLFLRAKLMLDYELVLPLVDREKGFVSGFGNFIFEEKTELYMRQLIKVRLHNSRIECDGKKYNIACVWHVSNKYKRNNARAPQIRMNQIKLPVPSIKLLMKDKNMFSEIELDE